MKSSVVCGCGLLLLSAIVACRQDESTSTIPAADASTPADAGGGDADAGARVDESRLGPACSKTEECASGLEDCYDFAGVGVKESPMRCVDGDPCALVTCPAGKKCFVLTRFPGAVVCDE